MGCEDQVCEDPADRHAWPGWCWANKKRAALENKETMTSAPVGCGMAQMQTTMSEAEGFSLQRDSEMKEAEGEAPAPVPAPAQEMLSRGELNS